jgi:hypothetical protein
MSALPPVGEAAYMNLRGWMTVRHSLAVEAGLAVALYLAYDGVRGLVSNDEGAAVAHARHVASLERSLHAVPGLIGSLNLAYLSLHLAVTGAMLLWLHRRRPDVFPFVRTTLLLASGLALIGFTVFPTAPPRLAALGIVDTSGRHLSLNHGLSTSFYNPYAAVPSMHIGYALAVGATVARQARALVVRVLGAVYPLAVLFIVVATGNHFFFDAAAGALTVTLAAAAAFLIGRGAPSRAAVTLVDHALVRPLQEELAAA